MSFPRQTQYPTTQQDEGETVTTQSEETVMAATDPATPEKRSVVARLEQEGDAAADFLEELLDIADLDGDIDLDVQGDRALVSVVGGDLSVLVGPEGQVLEALQELTRLAVLRETGERSRVLLDVAGHRARRRVALVELAEQTVLRVKDDGQPVRLEPMSSYERKVVHDAVAASGLTSESEGQEPQRRVVVSPA